MKRHKLQILDMDLVAILSTDFLTYNGKNNAAYGRTEQDNELLFKYFMFFLFVRVPVPVESAIW